MRVLTARRNRGLSLPSLLPAPYSLLLFCCLALAAGWAVRAAGAENILFMPTATQVSAGEERLNFSLVNLPGPGEGNLTLYEAYYGLSDALEISFLKANQTGAEASRAFNMSYIVTPETPYNWATVLGATNLGGDRYLGGDDPSYYIAFYRTRSEKRRTPRGWSPSYRFHLGYGTKVHDGFFGGAQIATSAQMWLGAFNYTGQPTYLIDYTLLENPGRRLSLRAGYLRGDPWIGLSYGAAGGG